MTFEFVSIFTILNFPYFNVKLISGQVFGAIVAYSTSGLLCAHAPDNGWPSIFYIHGKLQGYPTRL